MILHACMYRIPTVYMNNTRMSIANVCVFIYVYVHIYIFITIYVLQWENIFF